MAERFFQYYKLWNSSSVAGSEDSTLELTREHKSWGKTFQFSSAMYISILTYNMRFLACQSNEGPRENWEIIVQRDLDSNSY